MNFVRVNRNEYNNIDCIKVCMAVLVVATHTSFFSFISSKDVYNAVFTALSVKVPFFFAASGFLVWNKIYNARTEEKLVRIKSWIIKTLRLYIVWTLIYVPYTILGFHLEDTNIVQALLLFFRNLFLVGENYYSWQLWYLLGMLVAGILMYMMVKCEWKFSSMLYAAIFLAISGVILNKIIDNNVASNLTDIYLKLFKTTRNGFFQGFPYIMIGAAIAHYGVLTSQKILWGTLVFSFITHMMGFQISTFVMTYALFSLVAQFDLPQRKDSLYKNFRLTSTIVYLVHMLWIGIFTFIVHVQNTTIMFILVVSCSFLTAYVSIIYKDTKLVRLLFR